MGDFEVLYDLATATPALIRSVYRKSLWDIVHIDRERANNHSVDAIAKRAIAVGALALLITGAMPLVTSVHGQPTTQLEWEVQHLREQMQEMRSLPTDVALILAHQRLEDERYKETQEFQGKLLWGFVGTAGSTMMGLFLWALNQFGISIGSKEPRRRVA